MAGRKPLKRPKNGDGKEDHVAGKKPKTDPEVVDPTPDEFNRDILIAKTDVCALCKGDHDVGLQLKDKINVTNLEDDDGDENPHVHDPDSVLDVNGVWASKHPLKRKNRRLFVHFYCALSSPQVSFNGKSWANVAKEVYRGERLDCSSCGKKGATLGCIDPKCSINMHVPCAVKLGFRRKGFRVGFFCEQHLKQKADQERKTDIEMAGDVSRGREPVAVTCVNMLDDAAAKKVIEYTPVNLDSDEVTVNSRGVIVGGPVGADCCTCDGLCDDVSSCQCLAYGRNYTFGGGLIPGTERRILECNFRCTCSIRQVVNAAV
jgi:hypothetical protein